MENKDEFKKGKKEKIPMSKRKNTDE